MASNVDLRGQGNRHHHTAQTSYLDETFTFTNLNASNGPYTIGFLPAGARVLRAYGVTGTVFSGATTAQISVGGVAVTSAATVAALGTNPLATSAVTNVYNTTEQAAVTVTFTGGGALTTGLSDIIVEYATVHGPTGQF